MVPPCPAVAPILNNGHSDHPTLDMHIDYRHVFPNDRNQITNLEDFGTIGLEGNARCTTGILDACISVHSCFGRVLEKCKSCHCQTPSLFFENTKHPYSVQRRIVQTVVHYIVTRGPSGLALELLESVKPEEEEEEEEEVQKSPRKVDG